MFYEKVTQPDNLRKLNESIIYGLFCKNMNNI